MMIPWKDSPDDPYAIRCADEQVVADLYPLYVPRPTTNEPRKKLTERVKMEPQFLLLQALSHLSSLRSFGYDGTTLNGNQY
jgi:hypothetical protein